MCKIVQNSIIYLGVPDLYLIITLISLVWFFYKGKFSGGPSVSVIIIHLEAVALCFLETTTEVLDSKVLCLAKTLSTVESRWLLIGVHAAAGDARACQFVSLFLCGVLINSVFPAENSVFLSHQTSQQ